jgi:hypothetical protein
MFSNAGPATQVRHKLGLRVNRELGDREFLKKCGGPQASFGETRL